MSKSLTLIFQMSHKTVKKTQRKQQVKKQSNTPWPAAGVAEGGGAGSMREMIHPPNFFWHKLIGNRMGIDKVV